MKRIVSLAGHSRLRQALGISNRQSRGHQQMTSELVALLAVLVSFFSLLVSYLNVRATLATTRAMAWASKEADYRRSQMDAVRDVVSQFCVLSFSMRQRRMTLFPTVKIFPKD